MKKILSILILCQLLQYSGRSQNITYDSQHICFDSIAAKKVLLTIYQNRALSEEQALLKEMVMQYDSINTDHCSIIENQAKMMRYKTDSIAVLKMDYSTMEASKKKEATKYKWYIRILYAAVISCFFIKI